MTDLSGYIIDYVGSAAVLCIACLLPVASHAQQLPSAADIQRVAPAPKRTIVPETQQTQQPVPTLPASTPVPQGADTIRFTLEKITIEGMTAFKRSEINALYAEYLQQDISVANLWEIAGRITQHYRAKGYFLSRAYVPAQEIDGGRIVISVTEGYIADITLNATLSDHWLLSLYKKQILTERPLSAATLESFMLELNSLPGQEFHALIEPHANQDGAVKLSLTQEDQSSETFVRFDNYGSRFLGPYQATISHSDSYLPLQQTTVTGLTSIPFDELNYIALHHDIPFYPHWNAFMAANYVTSEPGATLKSNDIESSSVGLALGVTWQPVRQWNENFSVTFKLDGMNTNGDILDNNPLTRDRIRNLRIGAHYDNTDSWNGRNFLNTQLSKGLGMLGASDAGDANLSRAEGEPEATSLQLNAVRQQYLSDSVLGIAQISGQVASDPLLSAEEFGFGGQRFGRAYDPSEITGDHGVAASLELRYTALPLWQQLRVTPYGYYDHGAVWNEDTNMARESASSAGGGVYIGHDSGISATLGLAVPLTREIQTPLYGHDKNPRVLMQIGYQF